MNWPTRSVEHQELKNKLSAYSKNKHPLLGLVDGLTLDALAMQLVASQRREDYYRLVQRNQISANRANPNDPSFDAERAVAHHIQQGNVDEACWLIFLMTHFARHAATGWRRLQDVYGLMGTETLTWAKITDNPESFFNWLDQNWQGIGGAFGNHRKYESLRPDAKRPTGLVIRAYLNWVGQSHEELFEGFELEASNDPFDTLYRKMKVLGFGRLGKFDYLMQIGRYQILQITPRSAYLTGATGPSIGVKLLFMNDGNAKISTRDLQALLDPLDEELAVGMEVLEDALCNWQKSPQKFIHFIG